MELLSKEILDQIRAAKAMREAAKAEAAEEKAASAEPQEEYVNFRDLCNEVLDDEPARGLFQASW